MASEFHKRAISRITDEQRALIVKSIEIVSQIHAILDNRKIKQKELAEMLNVSPAAVSKMLSPGGNLEINTVVKLELLLKETIITTPQKIRKDENTILFIRMPQRSRDREAFMGVDYYQGEEAFGPFSMARTTATC
jgi:transcriptional regulator with XRE-family HTH domain